ncbi:MAG: B12-binding domain-containing radical SAM protein [Acidobacteriia bacterium]|nr:B12-binding domain-containing radical SAM protein [Terriglobia bacterium]
MTYRRLLFVYPDFDPTYWGMQHALPLVARKSLMPPLGLMTIAAMTPEQYEVRIVDMNCEPLTDEHIDWADMVLFSAMMMQQRTLFSAAQRCRKAGKPVVFGGPYPTSFTDECRPYCDYLVLNEGEVTWPMFLRDIQAGTLQPIYASSVKPDVSKTPCPRFDLVNVADYGMIPLQYSRGCPFQCEFCDIIVLYGRSPRTKTPAQMLAELDALYATGYRGGVFIVDDNFIGNKKEVLQFLPEMERWNRKHGHPFQYGTEATLNLAEDQRLLESVIRAGFLWVFIGIETPDVAALKESRKLQNVRGSLVDRVRVLQNAGLLVFGGFILGFDNETEDIFDRQIEFITQAAIPNAMVGQLGALPNTPLHERMQREGRLLRSLTEADGLGPFYCNFRTTLSFETLVRGQRRILETIYEPRAYFDRLLEAYRRLPKEKTLVRKLRRFLFPGGMVRGSKATGQARMLAQFTGKARLAALVQFLRSVEPGFRREALRFVRKIVLESPEHFQQSLDYLLTGYHYYLFTRDTVVPEYERVLADASAYPGLEPAETTPRDPAWTSSTAGIVQIAIATEAGSTSGAAYPRGDVPAHSGSALTVQS